jgi:hypothetical protein
MSQHDGCSRSMLDGMHAVYWLRWCSVLLASAAIAGAVVTRACCFFHVNERGQVNVVVWRSAVYDSDLTFSSASRWAPGWHVVSDGVAKQDARIMMFETHGASQRTELPFITVSIVSIFVAYAAWTTRTKFDYRCGECGYDLRGSASGYCPECGTPCPRTKRIDVGEKTELVSQERERGSRQ